jgi:hypothetical protein
MGVRARGYATVRRGYEQSRQENSVRRTEANCRDRYK